jgi:hypothetical protein
VTIEGYQVEVAELSACLLEVQGIQAEGVLEPHVTPEAESLTVGGEGQVQVEELGWGAHSPQQVGGEQTAGEPAEGALLVDGAQAVWSEQRYGTAHHWCSG